MADDRSTAQQNEWGGEMGTLYTQRNPQSIAEFDRVYLKDYNLTRGSMNEEFLSELPRDTKILEVGANIGSQLEFLRQMGFSDLTGVEINDFAIEEAKRIHPHIAVVKGSGFDLPFENASFDLVFTSGVLIHISPDDINRIIGEMHRTAKRYIWGFEYFAPTYTEVTYRGKQDLLWKTDFCKLFIDTFTDLKLVREQQYPMTDGVNVSQMYLLEKRP